MMKWGEFKAFVDEALKESGMGDDAEINFIDITQSTDDVDDVEVFPGEEDNDFCVW